MKCTERNYISRLKKKKEDALEYIMNHYGGLVHGITHQILGHISRQAVDECVNDTFLLIWQRAHQFDGDTKAFKKWVGMITKYKAIDYYRALEKQKTREKIDEQVILAQAIPDMQMTYIQKEQRDELLAAISGLPEIDRDIFMMKYFLDLPSGEIAEALQLSVSAIDNRLSRGRKKLAQNIKLKEQFI
ncbi:RNA polymerase subunit sigma-70 [Lysinibacillus sp. 2017]|uniref:sigma-70 family RNA polymerase sigma factor n=1 Tax=unclassified Lysinibacillus TaxID=2636778 RepID=UPI000D527574|nr:MULTISPECIES: sigma-70 family RNA polymerase sigma factor [unclassified Lysinibacillus]AWE07314.1 RNA polymerase subunit sigma-70 [Lysinibacillus sp. 2017]TGN32060.1 sigma-70 family RNA polymerase sigma factor [Lysinibacillus sp. S2017]